LIPGWKAANINAARDQQIVGYRKSLRRHWGAVRRSAHSIDFCEQGIDGVAQHGPERRVAFDAVRLPIRRIVGQYGDVARAALCAFERDGSIFARDALVAL
jgi:hypothetical protein